MEDESLGEYYCTGRNGLLTNDAWGSVNGFTSEEESRVCSHYVYPPCPVRERGTETTRSVWPVTTAEVTLHKVAKLSSSITLNEGCTVGLPLQRGMPRLTLETLYQSIFNTVVESTDPVLTLSDVKIEILCHRHHRLRRRAGQGLDALEGR